MTTQIIAGGEIITSVIVGSVGQGGGLSPADQAKLDSYPTLVTETENKFVRDDGQLVSIDMAVGGYANNLYFSEVASDVATYLTLSYTPDANETIHSHAVNSSEGNKLIHTFLYPSGVSVDLMPSGVWSFTFYGNVSAANGLTQLGITYFKRSTLGVETDLFTIWSDEINNTTADFIRFQMIEPSFVLDPTDRMGARVLIKTTHNNNITVNYRIGDGYAAYLNNPNKIRHSQTRDQNGDPAFQHITSAEKTKLQTIPDVTPAPIAHAVTIDLSKPFQTSQAILTGATEFSPIAGTAVEGFLHRKLLDLNGITPTFNVFLPYNTTETPDLVAGQIRRPNSKISKSIEAGTNAQRKRP